MRAGPHQFFAGISSPNSSLSLSKRQAPSVSPPAPSATASDERTCSSEPGERDRSSPARRGFSSTPQAGASPKDAGCSRRPSRRALRWPPGSWGKRSWGRRSWGRRTKIPFAWPSFFLGEASNEKTALARSVARKRAPCLAPSLCFPGKPCPRRERRKASPAVAVAPRCETYGSLAVQTRGHIPKILPCVVYERPLWIPFPEGFP